MKLTETQLREIRERCDAATAGPWVRDTSIDSIPFVSTKRGRCLVRHRETDVPAWHDCEFIAHARTDIPALLDDLAEAQKAHQTVKAHMDACRSLLNVPDDEVLYEAIKELKEELGEAKKVREEGEQFLVNEIARLRAERDALKAELEAQRHTALMWEQDFTALCKELGEEVTIETVDSSVQVAIEKVQALKAALAAYRQKKDQP